MDITSGGTVLFESGRKLLPAIGEETQRCGAEAYDIIENDSGVTNPLMISACALDSSTGHVAGPQQTRHPLWDRVA